MRSPHLTFITLLTLLVACNPATPPRAASPQPATPAVTAISTPSTEAPPTEPPPTEPPDTQPAPTPDPVAVPPALLPTSPAPTPEPTPPATPAAPVPVGLVTFTLDDSVSTDLSWAKPLFDKASVTGALACISGKVGQAGRLNAEQLRAFQTDGWEMLSHSVTHPHLARGSLTPEQVRQEITQSRTDLEAMKLKINVWVTPFGELDESPDVTDLVRQTYSASLVATGQINHRATFDPYHIQRISIDGHTLDDLRSRVDSAVQLGGWAVFVLHTGYTEYNTDPGWEARRQVVADLLAYVAALRAGGSVQTVTPSEGLALFTLPIGAQ